MKNILVVGGGGREHAIIMKLAESRHVGKIYCTPGNGGYLEHTPVQWHASDLQVCFRGRNQGEWLRR